MKRNSEHCIPCLGMHDHYLTKCLSKRGKRNCRLSTATEENKLNTPSAFFMNKSKSDCYIKHIFKCANGLEPKSKGIPDFPLPLRKIN